MQQLRCLKCEEVFLLTIPDKVDDTWRTSCSHCGAVHLLKPGFETVSVLPGREE